MRTFASLLLTSAAAGCGLVDPAPEVGTGVAALGGGGGWDYNSDRWNRLGEQLPFGRVAPNTISRREHVLWALATGTPPCVGATAGIDDAALRGSHLEAGEPIGPDVVVTRGPDTQALATGESVALAVAVRTEEEPVAAARSGAVVLTRVADFRRPPREGEPPTRYVWRQYRATYYPATTCAPLELGVATIAPAPRFPDGAPGYVLDTLPEVFELAMTYHEGQDAALLVKAAFNLDLSLALPGEVAPWVGPCGTSDAVDNRLAFLAAFAIGNASVVAIAASGDDSGGAGGSPPGGELIDDPGGGADPALGEVRTRLLFGTVRGQPMRASALIQDGPVARALCHGVETSPLGEVSANQRLAWPDDSVTELDAIMADGWSLGPGDRPADEAGFRLASGRSQRRMNAFLESSRLVERGEAAAQVAAHTAATRLGPYVGGLRRFAAVRGAIAGQAVTVVAIETMPPEDAEDSYDHEVELAISSPVCGDGVCGYPFGGAQPEACPLDCGGVILELPVKEELDAE